MVFQSPPRWHPTNSTLKVDTVLTGALSRVFREGLPCLNFGRPSGINTQHFLACPSNSSTALWKELVGEDGERLFGLLEDSLGHHLANVSLKLR
jgi:hypothetical protein